MIVSKLSFIYIQNYRIFTNFNMVDADMHNSSVCLSLVPFWFQHTST